MSPTSDIDMCISLPKFEKEPFRRGRSVKDPQAEIVGNKILQRLHKELGSCRDIYQGVRFLHGKRKLLYAQHVASNLEFQILTHQPIIPAREYTLYYLAEFPNLAALYILIRQALLIRELTYVPTGGIGSYPLLIMIVGALNSSDHRPAADDLATQLLHVLNFWADADLHYTGYAADPPRTFQKYDAKSIPGRDGSEQAQKDPYLRGLEQIIEENNRLFAGPTTSNIARRAVNVEGKRGRTQLCLQDPANPVNDLGKKSHTIKHVQAFFKVAREAVIEKMAHWDRMTEDGRMLTGDCLLDPLVKANYNDFDARREKIRRVALSWNNPSHV